MPRKGRGTSLPGPAVRIELIKKEVGRSGWPGSLGMQWRQVPYWTSLSHKPGPSKDKERRQESHELVTPALAAAQARGRKTSLITWSASPGNSGVWEAIRKRLNRRADNDTSRDPCQGCLNSTRKQLLLRAGDHFKGHWKKAESARKASWGSWEQAARVFRCRTNIPGNIAALFFHPSWLGMHTLGIFSCIVLGIRLVL